MSNHPSDDDQLYDEREYILWDDLANVLQQSAIEPPQPPSPPKGKRKRTQHQPQQPPREPMHYPPNWTYTTLAGLDTEISRIPPGWDYRLITAESDTCLICRASFRHNNMTAPNSFLNHARKGKHCRDRHANSQIVLIAVKEGGDDQEAETNPVAADKQDKRAPWFTYSDIENADPALYPNKYEWLSKIIPNQLPPGMAKARAPKGTAGLDESRSRKRSKRGDVDDLFRTGSPPIPRDFRHKYINPKEFKRLNAQRMALHRAPASDPGPSPRWDARDRTLHSQPDSPLVFPTPESLSDGGRSPYPPGLRFSPGTGRPVRPLPTHAATYMEGTHHHSRELPTTPSYPHAFHSVGCSPASFPSEAASYFEHRHHLSYPPYGSGHIVPGLGLQMSPRLGYHEPSFNMSPLGRNLPNSSGQHQQREASPPSAYDLPDAPEFQLAWGSVPSSLPQHQPTLASLMTDATGAPTPTPGAPPRLSISIPVDETNDVPSDVFNFHPEVFSRSSSLQNWNRETGAPISCVEDDKDVKFTLSDPQSWTITSGLSISPEWSNASAGSSSQGAHSDAGMSADAFNAQSPASSLQSTQSPNGFIIIDQPVVDPSSMAFIGGEAAHFAPFPQDVLGTPMPRQYPQQVMGYPSPLIHPILHSHQYELTASGASTPASSHSHGWVPLSGQDSFGSFNADEVVVNAMSMRRDRAEIARRMNATHK